MAFSTVFGGSDDDTGWGIALDRRGNPVVTGITDSSGLPGARSIFQTENNGKRDAFVATFLGRRHRKIQRPTWEAFPVTKADKMGGSTC